MKELTRRALQDRIERGAGNKSKRGKTMTRKKAEPSELKALSLHTATLILTGKTPLVCHKWSEKARQEIRDKQAKKPTAPREVRNPEAEFESSLYSFPDGRYGFPAKAIKKAAVDSAMLSGAKNKADSRSSFFVLGELVDGEPLVEIQGKPQMREDLVRIQGTSADLRYRGEFPTWKIQVQVEYDAATLSELQLLNLFRRAGWGIGIGENRPQKNGEWGRFTVELKQ